MRKFILTTLCCIVLSIAMAQDYQPELSSKAKNVIKEYATFKGDKLQTAILSDYSQIEVGKTIKVAIIFEIPMNYCIYSNEPSSSNIPTQIEWKLPDGVTIEKIVWQKPVKLSDRNKNGYFSSAIAVVHLRIADNYKGADVNIGAKISYQICDDLNCEAGENIEELKIIIGKAKKTKLFKLI